MGKTEQFYTGEVSTFISGLTIIQTNPNKFLQEGKILWDIVDESLHAYFIEGLRSAVSDNFHSIHMIHFLKYSKKWLKIHDISHIFIEFYISLLSTIIKKLNLGEPNLVLLIKEISNTLANNKLIEEDKAVIGKPLNVQMEMTAINTLTGRYFLLMCDVNIKLQKFSEILLCIKKFKNSISVLYLSSYYMHSLFETEANNLKIFLQELDLEKKSFLIKSYFLTIKTYMKDLFKYFEDQDLLLPIINEVNEVNEEYLINCMSKYILSMYIDGNLEEQNFYKYCINQTIIIQLVRHINYGTRQRIVEKEFQSHIIIFCKHLIDNSLIDNKIAPELINLIWVINTNNDEDFNLLLQNNIFITQLKLNFEDWQQSVDKEYYKIGTWLLGCINQSPISDSNQFLAYGTGKVLNNVISSLEAGDLQCRNLAENIKQELRDKNLNC